MPHHALSKMAANKASRKHHITAPSPLILSPKMVNPSATAKVDLWTLTNRKSPHVILPLDVVNPKPSVTFNTKVSQVTIAHPPKRNTQPGLHLGLARVMRAYIGLRVRVIESDGGFRVKIDLHRFKG